MYGCESWTIKKAEHKELMLLNCGLQKLLRVLWTARRSNQSILKEISPEYSLEGLVLKLKLQYFGHPMWRTDSLEKTLMLGKIEGRRRRGRQRMGWLDGITDSTDMGLGGLLRVGDGQGGLACCNSWGSKELDTTEQLNWTELNSQSYRVESPLNEDSMVHIYNAKIFVLQVFKFWLSIYQANSKTCIFRRDWCLWICEESFPVSKISQNKLKEKSHLLLIT